MDFEGKLHELSKEIQTHAKNITTEESTKTSLVMRFLKVLGYDVHDSNEIACELNADIGPKKGEKVDYAILRDGKPIVLVECKAVNADLTRENVSQLHRYYHATSARFGILTNGLRYQFFADIEEINKMDRHPFIEIGITDQITPSAVDVLKAFTKSDYDEKALINMAKEVKYKNLIKGLLAKQLDNPSDGFVRFFLDQVYNGRKTKQVHSKFSRIIRHSMHEFVTEQAPRHVREGSLGYSTSPGAPRGEKAIDPESPPDFKGSKITRALLNGQVVAKPDWNPLMAHMVALSMKDPKQHEMVRKICGSSVVDGERRDNGFRPVPYKGSCVSVRYQGANRAYVFISKIARCTNISLHSDIDFPDGSTKRLEIPK